jgi:outer membrane protein OmpA-like peptidoglycan-associated protein
MRARATDIAEPVGAAVRGALAAPARGLAGVERALLESRLGGDLGALRVHTGPEVDRAADRLGARGFAVGRHAALSSVARPETLAHEAAHALQQDMAEPRGAVPVLCAGAAPEREARAAAAGAAPVTAGHAPFLGRDLTDPGRLDEIHQAVRVEGPPQAAGAAPAAGPATNRLPWVDPKPTSGGTAAVIEQEVIDFLAGSTLRPTTMRTTGQELDTDATEVNRRVLARFPQIPNPLPDTEVPARARMSTPAEIAGNRQFLNQWFDNALRRLSTSAGSYAIDTSNAAYQAMRARLFAHATVGPLLVGLAARQSAYTEGEGGDRAVYMHESVADTDRVTTLIHEWVHLYRSTTFAEWVRAAADRKAYNEGMIEWLARKVMMSAELTNRDRYAEYVSAVDSQIAAHVSEDGIARAVFRGEVWRLETHSDQARAAFGAQTGIVEGGPREEEIAASRTSGGYSETVISGSHYRFINLGVDETAPKPEQVEAFRTVKRERLDPEPARGVRFVGHASSPGSEAHNLSLARRRAVAFYRMAQREGVSRTRLVDVARPPHFGESLPNVTEEDVVTRAMNRRVEMFLIDGAAP